MATANLTPASPESPSPRESVHLVDEVDRRLAPAAAICTLAAAAGNAEFLPGGALEDALGHARELIEEAQALVEAYHAAERATG